MTTVATKSRRRSRKKKRKETTESVGDDPMAREQSETAPTTTSA